MRSAAGVALKLLPLALGLALLSGPGMVAAQDASELHALEQQVRGLRSQERTDEAMAVAAQWLALGDGERELVRDFMNLVKGRGGGSGK